MSRPQRSFIDFIFKTSPQPVLSPASKTLSALFLALAPMLLVPTLLVTLATGQSPAPTTVSVFSANAPVFVDGGSPQPVVLGVKMFSDVPGRVLGCSFYKAVTNIGPHTITLWDASGNVLATQVSTSETASGKQSVLFTSPVSIPAKQTFTCGYFASAGHFSYDNNTFAVQKDAAPLHVPINGGVYAYSTHASTLPIGVWLGSNYWVDVLFSPSTGVTTWVSNVNFTASGGAATVAWTTAVPASSQVEYGASTTYGTFTTLAAALVTAHSVTLTGLSGGSTYHFRVRSSDSDSVQAVGRDFTLASVLPVSVATSPLNTTIISGGTQQFMAMVSNSVNPAVIWSASAGTMSSSGLFTAPTVSSPTSVTVTATSLADASKSSSAILTVSPGAPVFTVTPPALSFSGQVGATSVTPASLSVTNTGSGSLPFTGVSDQAWLLLSPATGTAPSILQVRSSIASLKVGTYTGHVTLSSGSVTKVVTVALTVTAPPVQHSVGLSWKASTNTHVVSYSMYRSTTSGSAYALSASAIGGVNYSDSNVVSGTIYYYVVASVDDQGRESGYSSEVKAIIP